MEEFMPIIKEFMRIYKMRYVKGVNETLNNSAGLTFEQLLGKKPDSKNIPDFNGIEIKTKLRYSNYPISLFTTSFDGPEKYEADSILKKYGRKDYQFSDRKTLTLDLVLNQKILFNNYYFELKIDEVARMTYIVIYDVFKGKSEKRCFVTYETYKEKLEKKLRKLCLVRASKRTSNDGLYFRYYNIKCFKLKNFDNFIELIKNGTIRFTIMLRVSRSGIDQGKQRNKNLVISIEYDDLHKMFDCIYEYGEN